MKTAFLTHPLFLEHDTGPGHPEKSDRLRAIETHLRKVGLWDELAHLPFEAALESDIARCHLPAHIARVKAMARSGGGMLDADTVVSPRSFEVALLASGAAMRAVQAVWSGDFDNAFVAARPPGHHAASGRDEENPWGFCLFNQVAVAARYAQHLGAKRVAILDFDVHHGNGTQEIFYEDGGVFFASIHESPLFPGSGAASEKGEGAGLGSTLNMPMDCVKPGRIYRRLPDGVLWLQQWKRLRLPLERFAPDLIILSAGFDAHKDDPLAHMKLEIEDFAALVAEAKKWATELCGGKLVAVLEGGYDLPALAQGVETTLRVMMSDKP